MQILVRKIAGLTLVTLAGCAEAPSLSEEAFLATGGPSQDGALSEDAGGALDAGPGGGLGGNEAGVIGGFDAGIAPDASGGGGAISPNDSGLALTDAASDTAVRLPDTSVVAPADTGTSSGTDAAQSGPEAGGGGGTAGGGGAACSPATCNNDCFLLERCCNESNECACLTPLSRECSLPSL